mgnify:CR=1 FL=1
MTHYLKFESEEQMSIALSDYYDDEDDLNVDDDKSCARMTCVEYNKTKAEGGKERGRRR